MIRSFLKKYALLLRAALAVAVVVGIKLLVHTLGWEVLSLNPLFSGIVAANVFLMGFLLNGVLSDYKESERLPGEVAAILETLCDEASYTHQRTKSPVAIAFYDQVVGLGQAIHNWFYKKATTHEMMAHLTGLNHSFLAFEPLTQANFIARIKTEHHALRRLLIRVHTIRETSFISSGYMIADAVSALLFVGLILAQITPFYESLFVVGVIVFLLSFLMLLIKDLDNPFGYYEGSSSEDVSLKPLERFLSRTKLVTDGEVASEPIQAP